jgi:hypothetical protein
MPVEAEHAPERLTALAVIAPSHPFASPSTTPWSIV